METKLSITIEARDWHFLVGVVLANQERVIPFDQLPQLIEVGRRINPDVPVIDPAKLSFRAREALGRLGVSTIADLCKVTEGQLRGVRNCGQTTIGEIRAYLRKLDLSLAGG